MKLYDNDRHRDTFTELVYELLSDDPTWDRANRIIDSFDSAPEVEVPDTTLGGTYVNIEWLKRTEVELKMYKGLAAHPQGGPSDNTIEIVKPVEGDSHLYLKPCRICGNAEIVYERYKHLAGERWRCWCTKCLACIDPGWAQDQLAVREIWNQSPPNEPLTLEELREMDGEPVWVEIPKNRVAEWCIAKFDPLMNRVRLWCSGGGWFDGRNCGKSVFVYCRRPEEIEHERLD